jgi:hypothetical protein
VALMPPTRHVTPDRHFSGDTMLGNPDFITVEIVMFFGLGFLLAALLMLAFMPAVHERAVRLTRRKYDPVPLSEKEMHAEKDRLRADFAISTRKLEHDIDCMQRNTAAQFTELARRADTITQLKETLDARDTLIAELQSQTGRMATVHSATEGELHAPKIENIAKAQALHEANQRIAALMSEIGALTAALNRRIHVYDTQQHEIMTLTSQSDVLRMQLEALAHPVHHSPALVPAVEHTSNGRAAPHGDSDVIRRALEAIQGNGHIAPSNGAVPFGH